MCHSNVLRVCSCLFIFWSCTEINSICCPISRQNLKSRFSPRLQRYCKDDQTRSDCVGHSETWPFIKQSSSLRVGFCTRIRVYFYVRVWSLHRGIGHTLGTVFQFSLVSILTVSFTFPPNFFPLQLTRTVQTIT